MKKGVLVFFLILMCSSIKINAQKATVNWITFEQLEDSLNIKPKKVFINFYADWCSYCKKMDQSTFTNQEVIALLNIKYYAVKMDAETKNNIVFDGKIYVNKEIGKSRKPIHQIALLLASRKNKAFSLPATIILNKDFKLEKRFFEYLSPKRMLEIIN